MPVCGRSCSWRQVLYGCRYRPRAITRIHEWSAPNVGQIRVCAPDSVFFPGAEEVDGTMEGAMRADLKAYPT